MIVPGYEQSDFTPFKEPDDGDHIICQELKKRKFYESRSKLE
jgi:hypothetical protein